MALIQTVHLSMANFKSAPVVPAVQNDTDRQIKMVIDDFDLTAGLTGKITFVRSDGTHYEASATLDTATNSFTADIDQALTQPGRTMVQLKVTDTLTVSSFSFVIFVEADNSGTVTPQEGIDLVTAVEAAESAADRAESAASTLELDATLTSATKAAQAKAVGDELDKLTDAVDTQFSYLVADAILDRLAPYLANAKYGFKTNVPFKSLSFSFLMYFGKSCTVEFSIKDASGTTYGTPVSKTFTVANAGDSAAVSVSFDFPDTLPIGQYYLWFMSNYAGSMSYGYTSASFPTFEYFEPTPDGGYNGNVGSTTVTNYRMLIEARVSGVAVVEVPSINSKNVYIRNESILGTFSAGGWTKSGNVLSINYQQESGNTWFTYELDVSKLTKNMLKVTGLVSMTSGNALRLYIFGTSLSGSTLYLQCGDLADEGDFSFVVDLSNFVIYNSLDLSKTVKIGFANQSRPCVASITDFDCVAYETIVPEKNVYDAIDNLYSKTESNSLSIMAMISSVGIVKSPDGTPFIITVSNNGTLGTIRAIPNKTLFVGNSLLTGNGSFGMNATDFTEDYYYHVTQAILDANSSATFDKISGTGFESCTSVAAANTWMANTLLSHLSNDLDLVVVQLGDNVNNLQMVETFSTTCKSLINYIREHAPNARVVWVGEWYSTAQKQQIIADACSATGTTFVDISPINIQENKSYVGAVIHKASSSTTEYTVDDVSDDSANHILTVKFSVNGNQYTSLLPYTSYTLNGTTLTVVSEYVITTLSGIASHPGNSGMLGVANAILVALGL